MQSVIRKLIYYTNNKIYRNRVNVYYGLYNLLSDESFIKKNFEIYMGYKLNLDNPRTYNEKLQWLKLNDRKSIYTTMVDKYAVKNYVASIIGEEYIIPTLGVWDCFEDIDFEELPNQFVLKCTHDSGGLVICKDKNKLDINSVRKKINRSLKRNYYYYGREWPYKDVEPRIIAEKYMENYSMSRLYDYYFYCFNGVVKCFKSDFDKFIKPQLKKNLSNGEVVFMGKEILVPDNGKAISECMYLKNLEKMFANKVLVTQPLFSADYYDNDGKNYIGELQFYSTSDFGELFTEVKEQLLGSWFKLPYDLEEGYWLIYKDMLCILNTNVSEGEDKNRYYDSPPLRDYKIYTFNGEAKICMINQDRGYHTKADYFDKDYNWLDFTWGYDHADVKPKKPKNYDKMFELAEKLAVGTYELRVDFYEVEGHVYFGELTFFDGSGFDAIKPFSYDELLGSWIQLPN